MFLLFYFIFKFFRNLTQRIIKLWAEPFKDNFLLNWCFDPIAARLKNVFIPYFSSVERSL